MRTLIEYATVPTALSDLLPWAALIAPFVLLNKNGSMQSTITYRGPDLDSSTPSDLISVVSRLNNLFRRFGDGWAIQVEARRRVASDYPDANFPDLVTAMIDDERRAMFDAGRHYESAYYVTLTYICEPMSSGKFEQLFFENELGHAVKTEKEVAREALALFSGEVTRFADALANILPDVQVLADSAFLTYLKSTVSTRSNHVEMPGTPMYLDAFLTDDSITGGLAPRLGQKYIHPITVRQFPTKSFPGILDALNRLGYEYRWCTRFIFLGREQAEKELQDSRKNWFAARKGFLTMLKEIVFQQPSQMENTDAVTRSVDADVALQELQGDHVAYGYFTQTVILLDADAEALTKKVGEVQRVIEARGFVTIDELHNRNAMEAWLGTIPGLHNHNVRYPIINTINLAHMMPLSAVWAGPLTCANDKMPPNSAPLMQAETNGTTPFRFSNFVGDVGHTAIIGPPGSGKDVLLNLMRAQWMRYPNAQVFTFDKGASALALTNAVGGDFYDLANTRHGLSFQPLARINEPNEKTWAAEWLSEILAFGRVELTAARKASIWDALGTLASGPIQERTMTGLQALVQDAELKKAIAPYTLNGPMGQLLDADKDVLQLSRWVTFEMEELLRLKSAVGPVLSYLFHRLDQRFDAGAPTLLILNEAWIYLDNEQMREKIKEWLKVVRKANVSVIFATQNISDFLKSSIADVIMETCMTKIYLPNPEAETPSVRLNYEMCGLNDKQISIIRNATPKRDYYLRTSEGTRLFQLALGPIGIAYCAATDKAMHPLLWELKTQHPFDTNSYNASYLRARSTGASPLNVGYAAEILENYNKGDL